MNNKDIAKVYKRWAKYHTPTWETDNLVHDLMGNPENEDDCVFLSKLMKNRYK
jgi:IS5 family transposase